MKRIYVKLNRQVGASEERFDDDTEWELIIPVRLKNGTFALPKNNPCHFYRDYILKGETVLENNWGGWNTLSKSDIILEMYSK